MTCTFSPKCNSVAVNKLSKCSKHKVNILKTWSRMRPEMFRRRAKVVKYLELVQDRFVCYVTKMKKGD